MGIGVTGKRLRGQSRSGGAEAAEWSALALIFHPISKPAVNGLPLVVVACTEIEKV
jgi:hypothetical protein